ncbi:MAG TPA: MraY family glycosyltransferase, partial [bacterium]|nr:MraY family glycosyltransferase [bacterium]
PNDRKIHKKATPRIGGVMIFLSFIVTYLLSEAYTHIMPSISFSKTLFLTCIIFSFLLGIIDDVRGIRAYKKLFIQFVIGLLVAYSGLRFQTINLFNITIDFGIFSYPITALWVVALFNAVNLIDGMDGLASGILMIALGFSLVISLIELNLFAALICGILLGSIMGFYIFNFPPAKIFMGDGGSYFLGCTYAMLSLMGMKKTSMAIMVAIPLVLLLIPLADVIYIMVRRTKRKESVFKADKNHIHHRLLNLGFSTRQINALVYLVCIAFGLIGMLIALTGGKFGILFFFLIMCLVVAGFLVIRILEKKA